MHKLPPGTAFRMRSGACSSHAARRALLLCLSHASLGKMSQKDVVDALVLAMHPVMRSPVRGSLKGVYSFSIPRAECRNISLINRVCVAVVGPNQANAPSVASRSGGAFVGRL